MFSFSCSGRRVVLLFRLRIYFDGSLLRPYLISRLKLFPRSHRATGCQLDVDGECVLDRVRGIGRGCRPSRHKTSTSVSVLGVRILFQLAKRNVVMSDDMHGVGAAALARSWRPLCRGGASEKMGSRPRSGSGNGLLEDVAGQQPDDGSDTSLGKKLCYKCRSSRVSYRAGVDRCKGYTPVKGKKSVRCIPMSA